MLQSKLTIAVLSLFMAMLSPLAAQRVITPVESNDLPIELKKPETPQPVDTVTTPVDTVPTHKAPLFGGLLLTADLAAPIMNIFGQQYGNYEVALEADFYHRFFPLVEIGIGTANYTPSDNNYTYVCHPAVYGRVGLNYNFFYNNGSESFFTIGLRYGLTGFSYEWRDITLTSSYWDNTTTTEIPVQSAFAHWGEAVIALRVQVYKDFYMGWSGRYRLLIGCDSSPYGEPWFIPGFGPKSGGFGFTYTIGYKLPIGGEKKSEKKEVKSL